jgi:CRP-like cAMP-binding protein
MFLDALPPAERTALQPQLERVHLDHEQVLANPNEPLAYAYFPIDAIVSILSFANGGDAVETGMVGREGVVGVPLFLGLEGDATRAVCQVPGDAWRLRAGAFRKALAHGGHLPVLLGRYTQALLAMAMQSVVCNRVHPVEERAARWLLLVHDRVEGDRLLLTHEFIAQMLGVRRASVTVVMGQLQGAGLLTYHRGTVTIRDREGLEAAACECYGKLAAQFDRLLGPLPHSSPANPGG